MLVHEFLLHFAVLSGDKIALVHDQKRVSYKTLGDHAEYVAQWLVQEGLSTGDRVAILTDNPTYYISCYFGILMAGGVAVGLNTQTSARSLDHVLTDCQPSFFLLSGPNTKFKKHLMSHFPKVRLEDADTLFSRDNRLPHTALLPSLNETNIAQIMYTSGSTGKPKGVILSHRNLTANTRSIIQYLGLTERDRAMAVLPFFYSYGNSVMLTHIAVGASLVVNQSFVYPNLILEQMINEKVTGLAGVPSTFAILLHRSAAREHTFPHLRYLTQAGAAMSPKLAAQLNALFPGSDIYIMYGQTEAAPRLSYLAPADLFRKPGSIGKAIPGVTLEVLRQDGTPALPGETGEIVAQGDNIMVGYWQRPEETSMALRDGKLWTGDLAYQDTDGFLFIVSRKSDMIKCGSHRIAPKEIEEIIMEIDGVVEVAVAGKTDQILGETISAYVVRQEHSSLNEKDIIRYCRANLPAFKVPHEVVFLKELPKNESGKIVKQELHKKSALSHNAPAKSNQCSTSKVNAIAPCVP
jgi:long-chain acyl-CoA synthetase